MDDESNDDTPSPQISSPADQEPDESVDPGYTPMSPDDSPEEQPSPQPSAPDGTPDGGTQYGPDWTPTDHGYAYTPEGEEGSPAPAALGKEWAINDAEFAAESLAKGTAAYNPAGLLLTGPVTLMEMETFPPDDPRATDPYGYCDEHGNYVATKPSDGEYPPYQPDENGEPPPSHWHGDGDSTGDESSPEGWE